MKYPQNLKPQPMKLYPKKNPFPLSRVGTHSSWFIAMKCMLTNCFGDYCLRERFFKQSWDTWELLCWDLQRLPSPPFTAKQESCWPIPLDFASSPLCAWGPGHLKGRCGLRNVAPSFPICCVAGSGHPKGRIEKQKPNKEKKTESNVVKTWIFILPMSRDSLHCSSSQFRWGSGGCVLAVGMVWDGFNWMLFILAFLTHLLWSLFSFSLPGPARKCPSLY